MVHVAQCNDQLRESMAGVLKNSINFQRYVLIFVISMQLTLIGQIDLVKRRLLVVMTRCMVVWVGYKQERRKFLGIRSSHGLKVPGFFSEFVFILIRGQSENLLFFYRIHYSISVIRRNSLDFQRIWRSLV